MTKIKNTFKIINISFEEVFLKKTVSSSNPKKGDKLRVRFRKSGRSETGRCMAVKMSGDVIIRVTSGEVFAVHPKTLVELHHKKRNKNKAKLRPNIK